MWRKRSAKDEEKYKSAYYWSGPYEVERVYQKDVKLHGDEKWLERVSRNRLKKFTVDTMTHLKRREDGPQLTEEEKRVIDREQEDAWRLAPSYQRVEELMKKQEVDSLELLKAKQKSLELKILLEKEKAEETERQRAITREKKELAEKDHQDYLRHREERLQKISRELQEELEKEKAKMRSRANKGKNVEIRRGARSRKGNKKYLDKDFE